MASKFSGWLATYDEFQTAIDRGEVTAAQAQLDTLQEKSLAVATEGLDYYEATKCLLMIAKADMMKGERRFEDCKRLLASATNLVPMRQWLHSLIRANLSMSQGNLALYQEDLDGAQEYYRLAEKHAFNAKSPILLANSLFNLGVCYSLLRQDSKAIDAFAQSADLYKESKAPSKTADAYHQIGNTLRLQGRRQEAVKFYVRAIEIYLQERNHAGLWRTGDDLSRVLYRLAAKARGTPDEEDLLKAAIDYSILATSSAEKTWQAAQEMQSEGRLADLSEQFLNHAITQCELALAVGDIELFLGALARSKGRIRRHTLPKISDIFSDWSPGLVARFESGDPRLAAFAVACALRELVAPNEVVAVVDQLSAHNSVLLSGVYLHQGGKTKLAWFESKLLQYSNAAELKCRSFRGNNRCIEAWGLAYQFIDKLYGHSEECCNAMNDGPLLASEAERARIKNLATELSDDAKALGKWFFPDKMVEFLRENRVTHVVLVADPLFHKIPYEALEISDGCVVDQPWSLSMATSVLEVIRWVIRSRIKNSFNWVSWFGPDRYVNNSLGGNDELLHLREKFQLEAYFVGEATREKMTSAIAAGHWVHFRGHGVWGGDIEKRGPLLSDGVLSRDVLESVSGAPAFVVATACMTGFSEAVGSEVFGSLVDYDRANCIGAVLTLWPIHGPFATRFMDEFYSALASGETVARAGKFASRRCRSFAVHPYFWAPFAAYGFWSCRLRAWSAPSAPS